MSSKTKKRWKPTIGAALGPQEIRLFDWLKTRGETAVKVLFAVITGYKGAVRNLPPQRTTQQRVGGVVSRLNKKLKGRRVVTGAKPGTYRIARVR